MRGHVLLDANLLVLLIVGSTDRSLIRSHRRLSAFTDADYDLLLATLATASSVTTTPNIMTETSNLVRQIARPAHDLIQLTFARFAAELPEIYWPSGQASADPSFARLGLSDAVSILAMSGAGASILTTDLDLYLAALSRGFLARNFNHLREGQTL